MDRLVECVPNFSEGRNHATVRALMLAVESVQGVWLLDQTMDRDHHRSVLSFAGEPDAVAEAAFRALRVATDLIDLRKHKGVHPRVGATDVVPFVPLRGATMQDCISLAKRLGRLRTVIMPRSNRSAGEDFKVSRFAWLPIRTGDQTVAPINFIRQPVPWWSVRDRP